jgi:transcriptional regulator with XRE-family HTH domain
MFLCKQAIVCDIGASMSIETSNNLQQSSNILRIVAARMRVLRLSLGMKTQAAFARRFAVSVETVGGIESGRRLPSVDLLIGMRRIGVDINRLLATEEGAGDGAAAPGAAHNAEMLLRCLLAASLTEADCHFIAIYCASDKNMKLSLQSFFSEEIQLQQKKGEEGHV